MNQLKPLDSGNILLVGVKSSNFGDDIKSNPRVIMWDSQNEHWLTKEIPHNVRAVFITRFVGHDAFRNIMSYARKKRITVFNPQGTGMIAKQVGELLAMPKPVQTVAQETKSVIIDSVTEAQKLIQPEVTENKVKVKKVYNKLKPLAPYIDATLTIAANAKMLMEHAKMGGIETTEASLGYFARQELLKIRGKIGKGNRAPRVKEVIPPTETDVSVQILDSTIKGLQDVRQYLIEVTKENQKLKAKLNKVKDWFNE